MTDFWPPGVVEIRTAMRGESRSDCSGNKSDRPSPFRSSPSCFVFGGFRRVTRRGKKIPQKDGGTLALTPALIAQASYHVPGDEASPDIRAAQASLWKSGLALEVSTEMRSRATFAKTAAKASNESSALA